MLSTWPPSLQQKLRLAEIGIWYRAFADEPDPLAMPLPAQMNDLRLWLPTAQNHDPLLYAQNLCATHADKKGYVLVPGQRFDLFGTRYGRGAGWFDRFLSVIPQTWLKIGMANKEQLSQTRLTRQTWDQPMDWLIVCDDGRWIAHEMASASHTPQHRDHHPAEQPKTRPKE